MMSAPFFGPPCQLVQQVLHGGDTGLMVLDFAGHGLRLPSLPRRQKRLPQSWIGLALVAPGPVMVFHALAPFFDDVRRVYAQGAGDPA